MGTVLGAAALSFLFLVSGLSADDAFFWSADDRLLVSLTGGPFVNPSRRALPAAALSLGGGSPKQVTLITAFPGQLFLGNPESSQACSMDFFFICSRVSVGLDDRAVWQDIYPWGPITHARHQSPLYSLPTETTPVARFSVTPCFPLTELSVVRAAVASTHSGVSFLGEQPSTHMRIKLKTAGTIVHLNIIFVRARIFFWFPFPKKIYGSNSKSLTKHFINSFCSCSAGQFT
jgi:hypothetical protein